MTAGSFASGVLAVLGCAAFNGSYYVPVKRHEIHDGLVYQWYQCSGILLAGLLWAFVNNAWNDPAGDFYLSWEGLLTGCVWTLANVFATLAVKMVGLGMYFILHELTNISGAFLVGVYGNYLGLDTTPPANVPLAALGVSFVVIGAMPVSLMRPEENHRADESEDQGIKNGQAEFQSSLAASRSVLESGKVAPADGSEFHEGFKAQRRLADLFEPDSPSRRYLNLNAITWDGTSPLLRPLSRNMRYKSNEALLRQLPMPLVLDDVISPNPSVTSPAPSQVSSADGDKLQPITEAASQNNVNASSFCQALGTFYCFSCGCLWSIMYLPMKPWIKRMKTNGKTVDSSDYLFSVCIGIYTSSIAWLLVKSAWKKLHRQPLQRSVLRPAILAGCVWTAGCLLQLASLQLLPYAVGYCASAGGSLLVSLLWGVFAFGEAKSHHNKKCISGSFVGVFIGMVLLGLSS